MLSAAAIFVEFDILVRQTALFQYPPVKPICVVDEFLQNHGRFWPARAVNGLKEFSSK